MLSKSKILNFLFTIEVGYITVSIIDYIVRGSISLPVPPIGMISLPISLFFAFVIGKLVLIPIKLLVRRYKSWKKKEMTKT